MLPKNFCRCVNIGRKHLQRGEEILVSSVRPEKMGVLTLTMRQKPMTYVWLPFITLTVFLLASGVAVAQFGVGLHHHWNEFQDPQGRFTVSVPPGWTYQPDMSDATVAVFFGPGAYDLFFLEVVPAAATGQNAAAHAREAIQHYQSNVLPQFSLLSGPTAGTLSGLDASFIVYAHTDASGAPVIEGRAFAVAGTDLYTIAFADHADTFDGRVALFNAVMDSLHIQAAQAPTTIAAAPGTSIARPGTGAAGAASATASTSTGTTASPGTAPSLGTEASPGPSGTAAAALDLYISPGGFYRFAPPADWTLWEEQSTAFGDTIEPWHELMNWPGKPMTKSLFTWDYFDEWLQTGGQYDVVMAVIENVPGTQADAAESLKNAVTGSSGNMYTTTTERIRLGAHAAFAVKIVVRPGMVEPWTMGTPWHRDVTFFVMKQGTTLFVWAVPDELRDAPQLTAAVNSFQWLGR